jgi:hypothetical protein
MTKNKICNHKIGTYEYILLCIICKLYICDKCVDAHDCKSNLK